MHHSTPHHGNVSSRPTNANDPKQRKEFREFSDARAPIRRRTLKLAVGLWVQGHVRQG
jgi:hypothetical protein